MALQQMRCTVNSFTDKKCRHNAETEDPSFRCFSKSDITKLQPFINRKGQVIRCLDDQSYEVRYGDHAYRRNRAHLKTSSRPTITTGGSDDDIKTILLKTDLSVCYLIEVSYYKFLIYWVGVNT